MVKYILTNLGMVALIVLILYASFKSENGSAQEYILVYTAVGLLMLLPFSLYKKKKKT